MRVSFAVISAIDFLPLGTRALSFVRVRRREEAATLEQRFAYFHRFLSSGRADTERREERYEDEIRRKYDTPAVR